MTIISTIAIILAIICAGLLGRAAVISNRRMKKINELNREIYRLNNCLNAINFSHHFYRKFYLQEEPDYHDRYCVYMAVTVRDGERIQCVEPVLIKSFIFRDDKQFALREAEELLEKLNEA